MGRWILEETAVLRRTAAHQRQRRRRRSGVLLLLLYRLVRGTVRRLLGGSILCSGYLLPFLGLRRRRRDLLGRAALPFRS